jgi:hypothetical protein
MPISIPFEILENERGPGLPRALGLGDGMVPGYFTSIIRRV